MFDETILSLCDELGSLLLHRKERVATAESCTGGLVGGALTAIAGSSAWFHGGLITYDNAIKSRWLDVRDETLATHGAVSEQTAREMAQGALIAMNAHWAISVTGIAGPGGAVHGKPVGTVCFGLARELSPDVIRTQSAIRRFEGDRTHVRYEAVHFVLGWLRDEIKRAGQG